MEQAPESCQNEQNRSSNLGVIRKKREQFSMQGPCASTESALHIEIDKQAGGNYKFANYYLLKFSSLKPENWTARSPWNKLQSRVKINKIRAVTLELLGSKENRTESFLG